MTCWTAAWTVAAGFSGRRVAQEWAAAFVCREGLLPVSDEEGPKGQPLEGGPFPFGRMPGGADRPGDSAYCVQLAPVVVMTTMPAMPSAAYRNGDEDAGLSADGDREKKQHNSPVAHGPSSLGYQTDGGAPAFLRTTQRT